MKKRILSILLCLCMVLTLFPVTVFANGETCTVTFDMNGREGNGVSPAPLTVPKGSKIEAPASPSQEEEYDGYNFVYWYVKGSGSRWYFDRDTVQSDLTLLAGWVDYPPVTIKATLDGEPYPGLTVEYRSTSAEGSTYTFTETSAGIYQYNGIKPDTYEFFVNNKYYALETVNLGTISYSPSLQFYSVTFDANGQEFTEETAPASKLCWKYDLWYDRSINKPADPVAKDSNYRFIGWTVGPERDSGAFDFVATSISSTTVIYAQWDRIVDENTFPVTAERATIVGSSHAKRGEDYHATLVPAAGYELPFRMTSHYYEQYYTHIKIGGQILNTANYTLNLDTGELTIPGEYITDRVEIVAVPRQNPYIVHFNANGGTGTQEGEGAKVYTDYKGYDYLYHKNTSGWYKLPSCTLTPPDGKMFSHWTYGLNYTNVINPGDSVMVFGDKTYYAIWKDAPEGTYTVAYNLTGCKFSGSTNAPNGSDYTTVITPKDGYAAPITLSSVQVGGNTLDNSEYLTAQDSETGALTLTVPGDKITGNMTITASAPAAHTHCVCGGNTDVGNHTSHTNVTWTGVSSLDEITGTGSYYLTGDILMDRDLNITGTVDLCLNGHQIYTQPGGRSNTVRIQTGAALNVCDCSEDERGLITTCRGEYAIENSGTLNLYSGSVERSSDDNGAAVKVNAGAVFNMYGGKIVGNAKAIITDGTVHVFGGTVSAKREAVYAKAGSEVTVSDNAALSVTGTSYSTIAIYGGAVNIRGGTVTNDFSSAVYVPYGGESTLNISGGEISTASSAKTDTIRLNSDSVEVTVTGGSITNGYAYPATSGSSLYGWAIGVYKVKSLTISGAPVINRIYLADGYRITVGEGGLTYETPIEIHCAKCPAPVTGDNNTDYSSKFTPRSSFYAIINAEDNVVLFTKAATVTYTDGVDTEEIFPDQTHNTYLGQPTPAFNGTPQRTGYDFAGWSPEVQETVTSNTTYTAQWTHKHSWAEDWSKNDTHHWHDCTAAGCGVANNADKNGYAAHTYDQQITTADYKASDATCTAKATYYKSCICGAKGTETFESGEVNAGNHTFGDWIDEVPATCKTTGTKGHKDCTSCNKHFDADGNEITDLTIPVDPANHEGTPGNWVKTDPDKHWKVYSCCGATVEEGTHVYDDDADTTCNTCDYERTITSSHTHSWATAWSKDDTHHWHECTADGCGVTENSDKDGYGEHDYDNDADTTCNTCGYVRTITPSHTHSWAEDWSNDETYHWHECTAEGCGVTENSDKDGYGEHDYDDDADTTCNTCGYVRTITPSHTHSWAEDWSKNETHHWHECTAEGCGVTDNAEKQGYGAHTYNQEIATADYKASDATCTAKATYYKSCICGAKGTATFESGEVNASNHTFGDWIDEVPATCKTTGTTGHKDCTGCHKRFDADGNEITDLTIPVDPDNHTTGKWQHNGLYHWKVCTICDEIVYKARHNYGGNRICDDCGYVKPRPSNPPTPSQPTDTTTKSPDTGDMGIALYAGMALLSLTGGAWVVNKKHKGK